MANTHQWMRGFDVTELEIVAQTIDPTTGVLADGTTTSIANLLPYLDEFDFAFRRITENVSPLNTRTAHHFRFLYAVEFTITEILRNEGTVPAALPKSLQSNIWHRFNSGTLPTISRIVRFRYERAGNLWTGFAEMTDYVEPIARTKQVGIGTYRSVDANSAVLYGLAS